ncbi:MAG: hypothetical protein KDC55_11480 [Ignavibacteriae bacterium]|nr:hypothetical protein [Ignavibacteriota bacterium]
MDNQSIKVPMWYWIAAIIFLLWNLMGIGSFLSHTLMKEEMIQTLSVAEQELYSNYPAWVFFAFAISVFNGTLGCIGLLLKKKWARSMFIVSLIGIIPQMTYVIFIANTAEVYGPSGLIMPIMIVVVGFFLVWYADSITKRGWLK